ncbi:DUF7260 family protein [Haloarcula marina]|uniref:DUF7260 family protein n=1 Tax=Haloarcula marina TaxID=2961574 RepID=UPI0020B72C99|nr:hypothetical protein [Halomicroarcula marina]
MADLDTRPGPREYLSSFRQHVRKPISNALERVQRERREEVRERDAFEAFADRVADLPTTSSTSQSVFAVTALPDRSTTDTEALRQAYRDTVMSVPHYETVYDESLTENVRAELGPEIAALFTSTTGPSLLLEHQRAVLSAAEQARTDREEFQDTLDAESESLRSLREDLTAVLDELDSTIVPAWYRQQFHDNLLAIIETRQSQLEERSIPQLDGHDLCESLYQDEPQTYPVLMAVARLHDCVTIRG